MSNSGCIFFRQNVGTSWSRSILIRANCLFRTCTNHLSNIRTRLPWLYRKDYLNVAVFSVQGESDAKRMGFSCTSAEPRRVPAPEAVSAEPSSKVRKREGISQKRNCFRHALPTFLSAGPLALKHDAITKLNTITMRCEPPRREGCLQLNEKRISLLSNVRACREWLRKKLGLFRSTVSSVEESGCECSLECVYALVRQQFYRYRYRLSL